MYTLGIRLYAIVITIASLFNKKAKDWVTGRQNWKSKLPNTNGKQVIWFHCASLGEFDQGLPVMNYMRQNCPDVFILTTFFSPSGMQHYHKRNHPCDFVCYLPIDTKRNASYFIEQIQPKMSVFVKYEFWQNYIKAAKKKDSLVYSISTLLRPSHHFFSPVFGKLTKSVLFDFDYFFVQNEETKKLLLDIGINKVEITGDTRFDRVIENKNQIQPNSIIAEFVADSAFTCIGGSVWKPDITLLKDVYFQRYFDKIILAPHQIDESTLQAIENAFPGECIRYTNYKKTRCKILILDTIGHLANAYSYGQIAYVGGGFSGNLHNILEPAVFGLPVIFGPKHSRFPEAGNFIAKEIGFSVNTPLELEHLLSELTKEKVSQLSENVKNVVLENTGASLKIGTYLTSNLKP